ncbi:mutS protein homolog 4-like [Phlebotomus argentipes]|uniref:mutS protein homolog 4-like n=1 Tax=Phlebotomus argentipes TaxID=94469 RepID=UPI00289362B3|nr:mutS protein homolog 4-like [Phlebotomus argentipes]
MNFIQQKPPHNAKNPVKRNTRNVPEISEQPKAGTSRGMLENFFSETGSGFLRPPPAAEAKKPHGKTSRNPGSGQTAGNSSASVEPHVILVITEGRNNARGEVGIAAIDINSPTLILSQLSDDMWYTGTVIKIQMLDPVEIIVPNTVLTEDRLVKDSKLLKIIFKAFPSVKIKPAMRKFFNDVEALESINELCSSHCQSVKLALEGKYYALAAAGGLFRYLRTVLCVVFAPKSLQIIYEAKYGSMMIDVETSKRLELVASLMPRKSKNSCLYQLLDKCVTNIGKRSLRARILAPFCDVKHIQEYQETVQELIENQPLLETLRQVLKKFKSVDKMQKLCVVVSQTDAIRAAELMISHIITFKSCLEAIPQLNDILSSLVHKNFDVMRQGLEDTRYSSILAEINKHIVSDIQHERGQKQFFQRIHAVKEGSNVFLDISRRLYYCLLEKLKTYVKSLSQTHEMSLELTHNTIRGYHVILTFDTKKPPPNIPTDFDIISRRGGKILLRNDEIASLDRRIRDVINEILIISNQVIDNMLVEIRKDIECFYMLTAVILEIDLIQNFATLATLDGYTCPSFGPELKITDGIHPFLEFGYNHVSPVPNNVCATSDYNFFMITGPNMGGKTVYIKTVAMLQIMAQIGAFVPATQATFRICDKLFSRMGFEDTVQRGVSNFDHEVRQTNYILRNITPNSVVIVDELGRSTNPREGKIWAWGMCEELAGLKGFSNDGRYFERDTESVINPDQAAKDVKKLQNITSPFIFLTTHFKELTKLPDYHFNMVNLYLEATENVQENGQVVLDYTHKVKLGVTPLKAYGLSLARQISFPKHVIPRAEELYKKLESVSERAEFEDNPEKPGCKDTLENERKLYDLYANLASILRSTSESSEDFVRQEVDKILKKFIETADPQFLMNVRTKSAPDVLNTSFSTVSDENLPRKSKVALNLESIREDLTNDRNLNNITSVFRSIINTPVEQIREISNVSSSSVTSSPPKILPEEREIVPPKVQKKSPSINFNLRTPFKPKSMENSSNQAAKEVDFFNTTKKTSSDDFFCTPGPSRDGRTTKDSSEIVNILTEDDDEEIQSEYEMVLSSQIVLTQDNSEEFFNSSTSRFKLDESPDHDSEDFFKKPPSKTSSDPWKRNFSDNKASDKEDSMSSISKITPVSFMERYRESVIRRMSESSSIQPIKPDKSKCHMKPSITHIPEVKQLMIRQQMQDAMSRSSGGSDEKSGQDVSAESTATQMSVLSGRNNWFPDVGTLQETQSSGSVSAEAEERPRKRERLVLDLAKLYELEDSVKK